MKEWITGRNPVYEVLRTRRRDVFRLWVAAGVEEKGKLAEILQMAAGRKLKVERVPRGQIDGIGEPGSQAQGVALETSGYPYVAMADIFERAQERKEPLFVLVLDMIQNPQNLGTLLRTAEVVGVHGVVIPLRRAASVTPAVVHASAGASEHLLVAVANLAQAIDELKEAGAWVIGLEGGGEAQLASSVRLDGPLALVVGNEGEGMRLLVRNNCDLLMRLPIHGQIDSLNAAMAGSVALYLALAAREKR